MMTFCLMEKIFSQLQEWWGFFCARAVWAFGLRAMVVRGVLEECRADVNLLFVCLGRVNLSDNFELK